MKGIMLLPKQDNKIRLRLKRQKCYYFYKNQIKIKEQFEFYKNYYLWLIRRRNTKITKCHIMYLLSKLLIKKQVKFHSSNS